MTETENSTERVTRANPLTGYRSEPTNQSLQIKRQTLKKTRS